MKNKLTPLQYDITQNCATEKAFDNEYWNNKEEGIYVDIVDGTVLFCSKHKYDSGSGWPSFFDVIDLKLINKTEDFDLGYKRIELKSEKSNSHLGHLFDDGPQPTGNRYCINSGSLLFICKKNMKKEGYGKYLDLFK